MAHISHILVAYFFQAGALFAERTRNFGLFLANFCYFVANLNNFWWASTGLSVCGGAPKLTNIRWVEVEFTQTDLILAIYIATKATIFTASKRIGQMTNIC